MFINISESAGKLAQCDLIKNCHKILNKQMRI